MTDVFARTGLHGNVPGLQTDQILVVADAQHPAVENAALITTLDSTTVTYTAAEPLKPNAAALAGYLLEACADAGVPIKDVLDQFAIGDSGRVYTAFDRNPLTDRVCRVAPAK